MSVQSTGSNKEERGATAFRPMTITVATASALSGICAAKIWALIKVGRLPVTRIDGRTLVHFQAFEQLVLTPDGPDAPKKQPPTTRRAAARAAAEASAEATSNATA